MPKMIRVEMDPSMAERHIMPNLKPGDTFAVKRGKVLMTSLRIPEVLNGKRIKSVPGRHWTQSCNM